MIIELVETILEEHNIFSYEYNKAGNYLSVKNDVKISPHSRQLELIKITNAFISHKVIYKVDEEYTIQIIV